MSKLLASIEEALRVCEIRDGMTLSFHHHLRDGDAVTPMVLLACERMGIHGLTLTTSGFMDGMARRPGMHTLLANGTIIGMDLTGCGSIYGEQLSKGALCNIAKYRTHGGRTAVIERGELPIDIAFVAASASDRCGNCNGVEGPNAFGSMGYAMVDALYAKKVVVVTDHLMPYPLARASIEERLVDYVVEVDNIGDTGGIASGILNPSRDPAAFCIGDYATGVLCHSGFFQEGFSLQVGGSGISIAATRQIREMMQKEKVHGSFILGGITGSSVNLLEDGLFDCILDTQSFDLQAVEHLRDHPERHREITVSAYASPAAKSAAVDSLDVTMLGCMQIDLNFDVNVNLLSNGYFTGGAGGHGDSAQGAKLAMVLAPLLRTRIPTVVPKVICRSTKGEYVDVLVTQYGVAVNPRRPELRERLVAAGLPVREIAVFESMAREMTGDPAPVRFGDRPVCEIYQRDGQLLDTIYNVEP